MPNLSKRLVDKKNVFAQKMAENPSFLERTASDILSENFKQTTYKAQVVIMPYIVDFLFTNEGLVVEVDGKDHLEEDRVRYDKSRDDRLRSAGYTVLRFTYDAVVNKPESFVQRINEELYRLRRLKKHERVKINRKFAGPHKSQQSKAKKPKKKKVKHVYYSDFDNRIGVYFSNVYRRH